ITPPIFPINLEIIRKYQIAVESKALSDCNTAYLNVLSASRETPGLRWSTIEAGDVDSHSGRLTWGKVVGPRSQRNYGHSNRSGEGWSRGLTREGKPIRTVEHSGGHRIADAVDVVKKDSN